MDEIKTVMEATSLNSKTQRVNLSGSRKKSAEIRNVSAKGKEVADDGWEELLNYPGVKPFEGRKNHIPSI